jgi:hypothetical protein
MYPEKEKRAIYTENGGVVYDPELVAESELTEEYDPEN